MFYGDTSSVAGVPSSGGLSVGARLGLKAIWAVPQVECLLHGRQDVIKGALGVSVCVCVRVFPFTGPWMLARLLNSTASCVIDLRVCA